MLLPLVTKEEKISGVGRASILHEWYPTERFLKDAVGGKGIDMFLNTAANFLLHAIKRYGINHVNVSDTNLQIMHLILAHLDA